MEMALLLKSIMGLSVLLAILVVFLYFPFGEKKKKQKKEVKAAREKPNTDLEYIRSVVKEKKSSLEEITKVLDVLLKYKGSIPAKLGLRPHPDSNIYMDIVFKTARHPNVDKNVVIRLITELEKLNPGYKKELNDALMRGLNSRGL